MNRVVQIEFKFCEARLEAPTFLLYLSIKAANHYSNRPSTNRFLRQEPLLSQFERPDGGILKSPIFLRRTISGSSWTPHYKKHKACELPWKDA